MTGTILLTGVTGFIAERIACDLLNAGYTVRGSLRSLQRADEVRDALRPQLSDPAALERLSFVELDLMSDTGWPEALSGVDGLFHTASPFPMSDPKDADALIRPAVDGTLRALRAAQAASVTRVVLTSSMVAMMYNAEADQGPVTEASWTDPDHPAANAYAQSKTLAERAAWEFVAAQPEMQLTTVNPGLVAGTPMDRHYGTSLRLIERILSAKDPMQPGIGLPIVDIQDVSQLHIQAYETPASIGHRLIASAGWHRLPQLAEWLAEAYPAKAIKTRVAPKLVLRLLSVFDSTVKGILPQVGKTLTIDASATRALMGIAFVPAKTAVLAAARFIEAGKA